MHSTTYSTRSQSGVTRREPRLSKYETTLVPFSDTSPLLFAENSATTDAAKYARLCTKALPNGNPRRRGVTGCHSTHYPVPGIPPRAVIEFPNAATRLRSERLPPVFGSRGIASKVP